MAASKTVRQLQLAVKLRYYLQLKWWQFRKKRTAWKAIEAFANKHDIEL